MNHLSQNVNKFHARFHRIKNRTIWNCNSQSCQNSLRIGLRNEIVNNFFLFFKFNFFIKIVNRLIEYQIRSRHRFTSECIHFIN